MDRRKPPERVHPRIKVPICVPDLPNKKEERGLPRDTGLPNTECMDRSRYIAITTHCPINREAPRKNPVYQIQYQVGIPQYPNKRRRPTQRSVQNAIGTIRTDGNEFWTKERSRYFPKNDEQTTPTN